MADENTTQQTEQADSKTQTEQTTQQTTIQQTTQTEPKERFVPADRFDAVVGQKYEAIRKAEAATARATELESRLAQFEAQQRQQAQPQLDAQGQPLQRQPEPQRPISAGELDRLAQVRADQMRFNERCNESVSSGRKAFADFDAKVDALRQVAPTVDAQGRPMLPQSLVEAALETGKGHEVLYALGSDPSEADRIMSLSPMRQAVELTKFALALGKTDDAGDDAAEVVRQARRASVPAPIRPVVGGSRSISVKDMALDDPGLPIEEFMKRRDEEIGRNRNRMNGRFR